jgi:hypothetical protein
MSTLFAGESSTFQVARELFFAAFPTGSSSAKEQNGRKQFLVEPGAMWYNLYHDIS